MKILLLGANPAVAWVRTFLEGASAGAAPGTVPELLVVQGPPTRELLAALLAEPTGALVLVDHRSVAAYPPPLALHPSDAVRSEAQWAVLALELARHATRTMVLEHSKAESWPASLAWLLSELLVAPLSEWTGNGSQSAPPGGAPATPADTSSSCPIWSRSSPRSRTRLGRSRWAGPAKPFSTGDTPGETLPATVEVAGRARILAYGPYLPLPSGSWRATAFLGFSPDIGKLPFILEADTGGAVVRGLFEVERGGIFTLRSTSRWPMPCSRSSYV